MSMFGADLQKFAQDAAGENLPVTMTVEAICNGLDCSDLKIEDWQWLFQQIFMDRGGLTDEIIADLDLETVGVRVCIGGVPYDATYQQFGSIVGRSLCALPQATTDELAAIRSAPEDHFLITCTADGGVVRFSISELTGGADQFPSCPNGPPVNYTYRDSWDVTTSVPLTTGLQFVAGDVGYTGAPPGTWIVDWQETVQTPGQDGNTIQNLFLRKIAC